MLQTRLIGRMIAYIGCKRTDSTVTPSLHRMMTTPQLRILANVRRVWRLINWQIVGETVWEGIKMTVALAIVAGMYTWEGTVKSYNWLQPRIANLLQHPMQTITKGPSFLYGECLEACLFSDDSTILQRMIVTVVSDCQTMMENASDKVDEIKYNVEEFVRTIRQNVSDFSFQVQSIV